MKIDRRNFLSLLALSPALLAQKMGIKDSPYVTKGISPNFTDQVILAEGLSYEILIKEQDTIGSSLKFGTHNDYLQFFSMTEERSLLWVNHEYVTPLLHTSLERLKKDIDLERLMVGGSIIEVQFKDGKWNVLKNSPLNRRIDGTTKIPFSNGVEILGSKVAEGTIGNCAGGKTPWGTVLTCEENFDLFYSTKERKSLLSWEKFYPNPPEHYGWVVEVEPLTGIAKKLVPLGRMAHECATVHPLSKNKTVVYTGDDANDQHLYKFISQNNTDLNQGTLYVAHFEKKQWIPLNLSNPLLKNKFKDQTELLIHTREAAKMVGATPLDRPEDIEVDPITGHVLIALTNNKWNKNYYGKILKIIEKNNNPESLNFDYQDYLVGGEKSGFACPDNLAFDQAGNLWFTSDIAGYEQYEGPYQNFGNNGLFVVLRQGPIKGIAIQMASAPIHAEFTGPLFSPDGKSLFLSVQHPGEYSKSLDELSSHWPDGSIPRSAVIVIQGPTLEKISKGNL
jgi:secreted PhoX family phosphatase